MLWSVGVSAECAGHFECCGSDWETDHVDCLNLPGGLAGPYQVGGDGGCAMTWVALFGGACGDAWDGVYTCSEL